MALAHDCEAAYSQAAKKVEDPKLKQALEKFASQASSQSDQWRGEALQIGSAHKKACVALLKLCMMWCCCMPL